MLDWLIDFFKPQKRRLADAAARLGQAVQTLKMTPIRYREFLIPKRSGGQRTICAPENDLKTLQRLLLRKLFRGLKVHPACYGFVRKRSIAHHAAVHKGRTLVFRVDIKDFFPSITRKRLYGYFRDIGWDREAAGWLADTTTYNGRLPQGAPTSPLLANAVNYRLDKRMTRVADKLGAAYSRYADDLTFSFPETTERAQTLLHCVYDILSDEGYAVQTHKKVRFMRSHDRQLVTGLVVNRKVALPRTLRRRLRAARHHLKVGKPATWSEAQLKGWASLESMVRVHGA